MSEAPSNVVAPSGSFNPLKAQEKRQDAAVDGADYVSAASLAQAAAELAALANAGGLSATKGAASNLAGFAGRDRGTSSRAFAGRGSAVEALGAPSDPTSRAVQQMKTGSSRHDPQARLEGKVPSQAPAASDQPSGIAESSGHDAARNESGKSASAPASGSSGAGGSADAKSAPMPGNGGSNAATAALSAAQGSVEAPAGGSKAPAAASAVNKIGGAVTIGGTKGAANPISGAGQSNGRGTQGQTAGSSGSNGSSSVKGGGSARGFDVTFEKAKQTKTGQSPTADAPEKPVEAQATRGLAALLRHKGGNVTLRLAPDSLGDLKIAMKLEGTKVWANIETTTALAHQLLDGQRESLRGALEAHGLTVERLEVSAPKPETAQASEHSGVKDHAREQAVQDSAMANQLASAGEERRSAEGRGGTPQGFVTGRSAQDEEAGGAGEMVLTVRGAPVKMWTEPNGSSMRLRVDAVA